jgi:hypothetical protein
LNLFSSLDWRVREIEPILDVNGKEAKMRKIPDDLPDK